MFPLFPLPLFSQDMDLASISASLALVIRNGDNDSSNGPVYNSSIRRIPGRQGGVNGWVYIKKWSRGGSLCVHWVSQTLIGCVRGGEGGRIV